MPRGAGCSYGDAAILDEGRLLLLDLPPGSDSYSGDSHSIVVSSAQTLRGLLSALAREGLTLPVVPGVLDATVGGVLAADAHGKNHRLRGSFRDVTHSLLLLLPTGEIIECDRDQNADLFAATIGGMGLTGMILEAQLEVIPLTAPRADVVVKKTRDLQSSIDQLRTLGDSHEHVAAWIDPTVSGKSFGRGIVVGGNPVIGPAPQRHSWNLSSGISFPRGLSGLLRPQVLRWHNQLRYRFTTATGDTQSWKLEQLLFPLERFPHWKRIYGADGFHQHQSLIPYSAGIQAIDQLITSASSGTLAPPLVVLKCFRRGGGWLSFPDEGWTLTMDLRADEKSKVLMKRLNEEVADLGGRVYLAKDSTLTPELLSRMYPDLPRFLELRQQVDPGQKVASELSRRLGL
ncbi:MAG: FAD-binding oxidoreductase [Planctomycetota bacterium]